MSIDREEELRALRQELRNAELDSHELRHLLMHRLRIENKLNQQRGEMRQERDAARDEAEAFQALTFALFRLATFPKQ